MSLGFSFPSIKLTNIPIKLAPVTNDYSPSFGFKGAAALFNMNHLLPFRDVSVADMNARRETVFQNLINDLTAVAKRDEESFQASLKPDMAVDGVWPPAPLTQTTEHFKKMSEEVKRLLTDEIKKMAEAWKKDAELHANARATQLMDLTVERIKRLEPFANQVANWFTTRYQPHFEAMMKKYQDGQERYSQAINDREAAKLLAEAKKARELAEQLQKQEQVLQMQDKQIQAGAAATQAAQLNKIADAKEALAEQKAPKSKVGIALAIAAAGALIMASQE